MSWRIRSGTSASRRAIRPGDVSAGVLDEMFKATDSSWAPWFVVRSDDKKRARLNAIKHLFGRIPY